MTGGSNVGLEHEIELDRVGELVTSGRISDIVLLDKFTKLGTTVVVNLPSVQVKLYPSLDSPELESTRILRQPHLRA